MIHRILLLALAAALPARAASSIAPAPVKPAAWKDAPRKPLLPAEVDALLERELEKAGLKPAAVVGDAQFLRRATLDLWGRPPKPAELEAFLKDTSADKRAKIIDKMLESDLYARNWASYWQEVMGARLVGFEGRILARPFQRWMAEQLKKNRPWSGITRDLLTASGVAKYDDSDGKTGPAYFLASHRGTDAVTEQAAETARVFMGIQINCAQCHDHPFDSWKQVQFHELAAYFARVRTRLVRDPESEQIRFIGLELASVDRGGFGMGMRPGMGGRFGGGEYRMPAKDGMRGGGTVVHPRALDGKAPAKGLKDADRRKALADSVTSKDNHWFAAAYANRVWGVLLGQSFYGQPDDLGPQREAVHGGTLARLASSFAATDYDMKAFFRLVMNTKAYQRESRIGETRGEHLLFAHSYPARLRAGAVHQSLINTLGDLPGGGFGGGGRGMMGPGGRFGFGGGVEGQIRTEFGFDPSLKNDDVESSIPQALILMNSPAIHQKIRATGTNFLAKALEKHKDDGPALEAVYAQALQRKPTAREQSRALSYVAKVGKRAEAFEDILWAIINSVEFQTRR
ncbi:MAG: DUF1549 and DUF1553 domain-containing protein [Gemmataceae bacterium]|nr:DUF1549 and DUF1553 domain-containing protein [Gemmataceae bacterium]